MIKREKKMESIKKVLKEGRYRGGQEDGKKEEHEEDCNGRHLRS